jgi:hypothetical protein
MLIFAEGQSKPLFKILDYHFRMAVLVLEAKSPLCEQQLL